ncbi:MAG: hemolysin family protein [Erysipelotrichaceae bacterium]|nr:hemolysin family protein [Erysipelotrichaceae bacterium]
MDNTILMIVLLLIASAFFSATETAYSGISKLKLKNMLNNGNKQAGKVLALAENYTKLLSTVLIGNNIVNILIATLFTLLFIRLVGEAKGPAISTIASTLFVLIFCEVTPKTIAKERPEMIAIAVYPIINFFIIIFTPMTYLFEQWKKVINIFFKHNNDEAIGSEELLTLVEEAQNEGGLDIHEASLVTNAIEFNDLDVRDILTPRIDVVAIDVNDNYDTIERMFRENNYSRIPVYEENIDNIIGILQEKDFYYSYYHAQKLTISQMMKDVQYTSGHVKIASLLRQLQQTKSHMAIVIDEYGGTEGIITMEDILEELVGEIYDEHDEIEVFIKKVNDSTYMVKGDAEIKVLFEYFNLELEEEFDFITVSGWAIHSLDRLPNKNDTFKYQNLIVTVVECDDKKVKKLKIVRN